MRRKHSSRMCKSDFNVNTEKDLTRIHSSRMRTARLLMYRGRGLHQGGVCIKGIGLHPGVGLHPWGGGVCINPGEGFCLGGICLGASRGSAKGVYPPRSASRGVIIQGGLHQGVCIGGLHPGEGVCLGGSA